MPSPRGTNRACRFIIDRTLTGAAYDAKPQDNDVAMLELVEFLRGKLSEGDLGEFCRLAGIDPGVTMDSPEPFRGMPTPGGGKFGEDARRRRPAMDAKSSFEQRFPHAARIKISA